MKKLHLLNPLCLVFVWQKTGNTGQPAELTGEYQWLLPASCFLNNLGKMCTREVMRTVSDASEFPVLQSNSSLLLDSVYDCVLSVLFWAVPFIISVFLSFCVRVVPCPEIHAWEASHKCLRTLFKTMWIPHRTMASCAVVSMGNVLLTSAGSYQSVLHLQVVLHCLSAEEWKELIVREKNLLLGCSYPVLRVTT